jgi:hypothetical protein
VEAAKDNRMRNKRNALVIFLLSLFVRLAYGWSSLNFPANALGNDSHGYLKLAAELAQGRFSSLFRTPGYPLFLLLTGGFPNTSLTITLLVQMLLDSLTAVLLAAIAWRLWRNQLGALLTGLIYALCPVAAVMSASILSETLSVFLIVAAFWLGLSQVSRFSTTLQVICWTGATLTRPFCVLLPLIVVFFLLLRAWQTDTEWSRRWKSQVAVLLLYACCISTWIGWNYYRAGLAVLCTNPDVSFYIYEIPALRLVEQLSWPGYLRLALGQPKEFDRLGLEHQKAYARELFPAANPVPQDLWFTMDDPASIRRIRADAALQARGRLLDLIGIHLTGALQTMRPKWASAGLPTRFLELLRLLLLPLAALVLCWKRQWWLLALFGVWTLYVVLAPGPCAFWRFRSLIEPVISLVLASAGMLLPTGVPLRKTEHVSGTPVPELVALSKKLPA